LQFTTGSSSNGNAAFSITDQELSLKDFNIRIIQHLLDNNDYDVVTVAKKLDIGKSTIYRMIQNNELNLIKKQE